MTNKLRKVYELEGLICDLHAHSENTPFGISKSQATDLISSTVFDYETNTRLGACLYIISILICCTTNIRKMKHTKEHSSKNVRLSEL